MAIMSSTVQWSAPAIPKLTHNETQLQLTSTEITWMVSSLYIGNLLGPIPAAYFMDKFGRKNTLLYMSIFPISSWIIILFATKPYHLYIARFLGGIQMGFVYTILPNYIAEISEPKIRGSLSNLMQIMLNVGGLYEYTIGPYVSYNTLIYASLSIPIIFVITFIWMPESPYYNVMINKNHEAMKSLTWLRCHKHKNDIINELTLIDSSVNEQIKSKSKYIDLISTKGNTKALIIAIVLSISQRLTGIGALMAYSSVTIPKNSIPGLTVNHCITILGIVWFITSILSTSIVYHQKRRTLLILSSFGCSISTLLTSIWFFLEENLKYTVISDKIRWLPYISFISHAIFYAIGMGPVGGSLRAELFPANIKGKASAISSTLLAITSFMIGKSYLIIANNYGMYLNYLIYSLSCLICMIFVKFYVIETKDKTLQEIQDELNGFKKSITQKNQNTRL